MSLQIVIASCHVFATCHVMQERDCNVARDACEDNLGKKMFTRGSAGTRIAVTNCYKNLRVNGHGRSK